VPVGSRLAPDTHVVEASTAGVPDRARLSPLDPVTAASVVVALAPVGYLLGWLLVVHLVSLPTAVWLSTVLVSVLGLLIVAAR
jgi:hypothetical protein